MVSVPVVPDRPETRDELIELKKKCKIGIFGSYTNANKTQLSLLQIFLKSNNYLNTHLATDLQETFNRFEGETESEYDHRISDKLITYCNIHIFVVFCENAEEHGTNISVFGEIQESRHRRRKNIILYYQKGAQHQVGNYFKTYLVDPNYSWKPYDFKKELKEKYDQILGQLFEMCHRVSQNSR